MVHLYIHWIKLNTRWSNENTDDVYFPVLCRLIFQLHCIVILFECFLILSRFSSSSVYNCSSSIFSSSPSFIQNISPSLSTLLWPKLPFPITKPKRPIAADGTYFIITEKAVLWTKFLKIRSEKSTSCIDRIETWPCKRRPLQNQKRACKHKNYWKV